MDLSSALTMEGPLEKQSPSVFKNFQSRYFAIRGKGEYLVWFKKKPQKPDQNPQGIISLDTIKQIKQNQSDYRVFHIQYLQRKFTLRAETELVKERWVNSLKTIVNYHQKVNKNRKKQLENTNESWKWKSIANKDISEQIRLENQQMILQDGDDSKGNQSQGMLSHIFKDKVNDPDLQKCIIHGFYAKKGMLTSTTRWFMLVSQINLFDENDEQLYYGVPDILEEVSNREQSVPKPEQNLKKRRKMSSSDSQNQAQQLKKKEEKKKQKMLKTNCLYEYDEQTKLLKHSYDLLNIIDYQLIAEQTPYSLKITYEETVNEEEQEVKEVQMILTNNFLIEIRKLFQGLNLLFERFNLAQLRQKMLNTRSKKYSIKKWKFENEENWFVPEKAKETFSLFINKKIVRFNKIEIDLALIQDSKEEAVKGTTEEEKQLAVVTIKYRKNQEQKEVQSAQFVFVNRQSSKKFNKKLMRNLKKIEEEKRLQEEKNRIQKKIQEKKINPDTYLIDKKVRESQSSIKVNFYELMDRQLIAQKVEDSNKNNNGGFWSSISAFFCAAPSSHDIQ